MREYFNLFTIIERGNCPELSLAIILIVAQEVGVQFVPLKELFLLDIGIGGHNWKSTRLSYGQERFQYLKGREIRSIH